MLREEMAKGKLQHSESLMVAADKPTLAGRWDLDALQKRDASGSAASGNAAGEIQTQSASCNGPAVHISEARGGQSLAASL